MAIKTVRDFVNGRVNEIEDEQRRFHFYAHLNGVAVYSTMLALRRGLDARLAVAAALLHDIAAVTRGTYEDHAHIGAEISREFLRAAKLFSPEEINIIAEAIHKHDDPDSAKHGQYDTVLREADFLDNNLRELKPFASKEREEKVYGLLK